MEFGPYTSMEVCMNCMCQVFCRVFTAHVHLLSYLVLIILIILMLCTIAYIHNTFPCVHSVCSLEWKLFKKSVRLFKNDVEIFHFPGRIYIISYGAARYSRWNPMIGKLWSCVMNSLANGITHVSLYHAPDASIPSSDTLRPPET